MECAVHVRLAVQRAVLWAKGPQESAQGAARNEQALGLGDHAPPLPRPRSEGAQERWRTGLCHAWSLFARHTVSRAPLVRDDLGNEGDCVNPGRRWLRHLALG